MNDLTDKFWNRLHLELNDESDRSIVIVACALLDEALKEIVKARLIPAKKKNLCIISDGNSPISSLSSRINLCYQLGLISDSMQRDLHIIRKLRNDFAHNPFDLSFNSSAVIQRIDELDKIANYAKHNQVARKNIGPPGTKDDFIFAISWRLYSLTESVKEIVPSKESALEFGYQNLKE